MSRCSSVGAAGAAGAAGWADAGLGGQCMTELALPTGASVYSAVQKARWRVQGDIAGEGFGFGEVLRYSGRSE